ncbi:MULTISPECIES: flagellar hook-length control protein FliK [unclassified Marinobacter]|uniref:flagellar hook-length control protein FliK n=1 Tax=unclassified Marinobacter TaxID=83889 RepID=UPI0026E1900E|nr:MULTISPECIES: flagellar hook-length control protein FliK [unclassified Marinobacter]MDO6440786.1 flagellar hook-length control protein FliK [Marinobacter sp. 2_MG-2023]MDO6823613.1 flagellar hook-length control protein FliK [Marinobacter sp. 1_MG-2023]
MKLPSSQQPPTPPAPATAQPAQPRDAGQIGRETATLSARQQLDQLQLANRETILARVAEVINRQGSGNADLLLDVRGKSLQVSAAIGATELTPGDWVKVMRAGNELQLMGKLAAAPEAIITRALAQRMPWQQSLDSGLAKLMTALNRGVIPELTPGQLPGARSPQPLPEAARQAAETLLARLPASNTLAPGAGTQNNSVQQIRQWVAESGLFAESRLTQAPSPALPDLKLAIGRMITALLAEQTGDATTTFNRLSPLASPGLVQAPLQFPQVPASPAPANNSEPTSVGQTLRMLAGMLNRITVNQLHSQILTARGGADAPAPTSTMLMDLPWVTPQNEPRLAQLRIEQHKDESPSKDRGLKRAAISEWRLNLAIDLERAGALNFEVSLRQQDISARVWAEKQDTLRQVNEELPLLRQSLTELGLEVTDLECRRGSPSYPATKLEHRLVDTRA